MLIFALVLLFVITSAFLGFLLTRVPFVPSREYEIKFITKKLGISSNNVFYDLGSGNGKVCFLVNELTGAKCVGFELTWWAHLLAKIRLWWKINSPFSPSFEKRGAGGVKFKNQNFFKTDWLEANFIYAYLYPPVMGMVETKFIEDCKPGTIAIVKDFPFPNLKPQEIYKMPKRHEIYIYKKL